MPAVALVYKVTNAQIGQVTVDAVVQEVHTAEVDTTENPVEQGIDVTDHARPKPRTISIDGVVSDTPIPSGASIPGRAFTAYALLLDFWQNPQLISIVTGLESFDNMLVKSLVVSRNAQSGRAVQFKALAQEVQIVQNQTVQIARTGKALPNANLNKQAPTPAPGPPKSPLLQGVGAATKVIPLGTGGFFQ